MVIRAGRVGQWIAKWRGRRDRRTRPTGGVDRVARARLQARRLAAATDACRDLRIALWTGDVERAARAIRKGLAGDAAHPEFIELRAWYALQAGCTDQALEVLEKYARPTARLKLLTQAMRCLAGRKAQAHLELSQWARQDDCPTLGRVLLAWLDLEADQPEHAAAALQRNLARGLDPMTGQLQVLVDLAQELPEATREAAERLLHQAGHDPSTRRFLGSLSLTETASKHIPLETVEQLAAELIGEPQLIPTLVRAQQINPQSSQIDLLRRSLARVVSDLDAPYVAIEALAELAVVADDADDARRWIQRGLQEQPFSARLAILLDNLPNDESEPKAGLRPLDVLRRAAGAEPTYPDLRRRLILRHHQAGYHQAARHQAGNWLDAEPSNDLARMTWREGAA